MRLNLVKKQGLLGLRVNGGSAALVELNCETDFVARNQKFLALLEEVHIVHFSILPYPSPPPKHCTMATFLRIIPWYSNYSPVSRV